MTEEQLVKIIGTLVMGVAFCVYFSFKLIRRFKRIQRQRKELLDLKKSISKSSEPKELYRDNSSVNSQLYYEDAAKMFNEYKEDRDSTIWEGQYVKNIRLRAGQRIPMLDPCQINLDFIAKDRTWRVSVDKDSHNVITWYYVLPWPTSVKFLKIKVLQEGMATNPAMNNNFEIQPKLDLTKDLAMVFFNRSVRSYLFDLNYLGKNLFPVESLAYEEFSIGESTRIDLLNFFEEQTGIFSSRKDLNDALALVKRRGFKLEGSMQDKLNEIQLADQKILSVLNKLNNSCADFSWFLLEWQEFFQLANEVKT